MAELNSTTVLGNVAAFDKVKSSGVIYTHRVVLTTGAPKRIGPSYTFTYVSNSPTKLTTFTEVLNSLHANTAAICSQRTRPITITEARLYYKDSNTIGVNYTLNGTVTTTTITSLSSVTDTILF